MIDIYTNIVVYVSTGLPLHQYSFYRVGAKTKAMREPFVRAEQKYNRTQSHHATHLYN